MAREQSISMNDPEFIVFGKPLIEEPEIAEVVACLRSGWLGTGPRVAKFEAEFGSYKSVPANRVAAVNSCTAALHLALLSIEAPEGSEVITTPLTFCATINAIIHAGLRPVLADVDAVTQCISPEAVAAAVTPRTVAILPVHFAGRPCDMDSLTSIANENGLKVIEDCAHAIETEYRGQKAGTFGEFGCFSFYSTKNVATGEGGMILASDEALASRARNLALHGMSKDAWHRFSDKGYRHYEVVDVGFKYNMMDLQAAIGIHQLARVEANWLKRQDIWNRYMAAFTDLPLGLPAAPEPRTRHAHHLFTALIDHARTGISRDSFIETMHSRGIGTGVHYLSVPEHPVYQQRFGWRPDEWPNARRIGRETVSLPLSPGLREQDVERVVSEVCRTLTRST